MKTAKIRVNKTAEKPEGVEIEIVQPDNAFEGKVLGFLLTHAVREAKHDNRIPYKLPASFTIDHRGEGTFVIQGTPTPPPSATPVRGGGYYQPPRPLAIVGLRVLGQNFELIHAELNPEALKKVAEAAQPKAQPRAEGSAPAPASPAAPDQYPSSSPAAQEHASDDKTEPASEPEP